MSGSRSHFLSAVLGGLVMAVVMAMLPAIAANGDSAVLGTRNTSANATKFIGRNATQLENTKAGRPALRLIVKPGAPPMAVNSAVLVVDLNADLLDGRDASAFAGSAAALGTGLPSLGFGCLLQGGNLVAFSRDGSPVCTAPGGTAQFTDSGQTLGAHETYGLALGDLDGDGDLDAYTANAYTANRVWINDGSGTFTDSGQTLGTSATFGVALGDLDGDGDLDAYTANWAEEGNRVWINDGNGTFTDSGQSLGTTSTQDVALGDLDGDGDLDAFTVNTGSAAPGSRVWVNDGTGTFTDSGQSLGTDITYAVALGDLDGDGDLDAYTANGGANRVWVNDGNGTFTDTEQPLGTSSTFGVALGDLDGDGDLDAYTANHGGQPNRIWLNAGNGKFADSGQSLGIYSAEGVALGDFDGDGSLDAYIADSYLADRVWLNDGTGTFTDSGLTLGSGDRRDLALGDVDGDGDLDAFIANYDEPNEVWENQ